MTVAEDLTRDSYARLVTEANRPVIIDCWGPQCAPCLMLEPTFHELSERFGHSLTFLRVEAPRNRMLCVDLRVMSLPTFLCLSGGDEVSRLDGDISREALAAWVQEQQERGKGGDGSR